jgi:photosystem II stability/assembly factor-like uncharacterized protein
MFKDRLHGFEAVTYFSAESSAVALFATDNGGRYWHEDRLITNLPPDSGGSVIPSAIADSNWLLAFTPAGMRPTLLKLRTGETLNSSYGGTDSEFRQCTLSFADSKAGWMLCSRALLLTTDGGNSWSEIAPQAHLETHLGEQMLTSP